MITDPDIDYTTAPANLMKHVEFMHKVGRIKHMPSLAGHNLCRGARPEGQLSDARSIGL
jgi:hypothetical protein